MEEKSKWIECTCGLADDAIRVSYYRDDEYDEEDFYIEMKLSVYPGPWWINGFGYLKNLWNAMKGRPNTYMSCWTGSRKEASQLRDVLDKFLRKNDE